MTTKRKVRELNAHEWRQVFEARCLSKRGLPVSPEQQALVDLAYKSDPDRYGKLDPDVFDATVPFGSGARARRS
jgi:hypothetical protein